MRHTAALPALALGLLGSLALVGCAELGVPEITGETVDSILAAPVSPDPATLTDPGTSPAPEATPAFFASNDGYAMTIPAGWTAARVSPDETGLVLDLLGRSDPVLGDLARSAIEQAGAWVSMVGGDLSANTDGQVPPGVVVLVLPSVGTSDDATEELVLTLIEAVAVDGGPARKVVGTPAGDAHRFQFSVTGDLVGPVTIRAFLYSEGSDAVVVAFASAAATWSQVDDVFSSMIRSLRFGV
jgi:hypothetical protein